MWGQFHGSATRVGTSSVSGPRGPSNNLTVLWAKKIGYAIRSSPAVDGYGNIYFGSNHQVSLHARAVYFFCVICVVLSGICVYIYIYIDICVRVCV